MSIATTRREWIPGHDRELHTCRSQAGLPSIGQACGEKALTARQAGAHAKHIANRVRVALKPSYTEQAARRSKSEIATLTEAGTITPNAARAYRAHITKRTEAA